MSSDILAAAANILRFYFSDSNLLKDRFLKTTIASSPEGWVSVQILNTFNKLRAATNGDLKCIADAAALCKDVLELRFDSDVIFEARCRSSVDDWTHRTV